MDWNGLWILFVDQMGLNFICVWTGFKACMWTRFEAACGLGLYYMWTGFGGVCGLGLYFHMDKFGACIWSESYLTKD